MPFSVLERGLRAAVIAVVSGAVLAAGAAEARKPYRVYRTATPRAAHDHLLVVKIGPIDLPADRDREVCQYIEIPFDKVPTYCVPGASPGDPEVCGLMIVGYDWSMRGGGSHHMVFYSYEGTTTSADTFPKEMQDSVACFDFGPPDHIYQSSRLGGTQTRRSRRLMRPGVGELVKPVRHPDGRPRGFGLILNAHAVVTGKRAKGIGKMKLRLARPRTVHAYAKRIFDVWANVFMSIPPGTAQKASSDWRVGGPGLPVVGGPPPNDACIVNVGAHHHKRTLLFTADLVDEQGTRRVHDNTDWFHPKDESEFFPPLLMRRGKHFHYECEIDNGITRDVKMGCELEPGVPPGKTLFQAYIEEGRFDGASHACAIDADCAGIGTGRCVPANLVFGYTSDDEMCVFAGLYYDAVPGAPPGRECDVSLLPPL